MDAGFRELAFEVDGDPYTWADVTLAARLRGEWDELERQARESLASRARADAEGDPIPEQAIDDAAVAFRYEHDLLAADELDEWLDARRLSMDEWVEWVRGALLRDHWAAKIEATLAAHPPRDGELERWLWVEGVCSGALDDFARRLAGRAAAHAALEGGDTARDRAEQLAAIDRSWEAYRRGLVSAEAIRREIAGRTVDWLRIEWEMLAFPKREMAEEAVLCVREDGRRLADVAGESRVRLERRRTYLDELAADLAGPLTSAQPGELLGPIETEGGHAVIVVDHKQPPSAEDPAIRERVGRELVDRAIERELAARVRWHGGL